MTDLDNKLQNMILAAIPASMMPTLVLFDTAKTMWDELLTQYEGTAETIINRKVALNKKYESFFALPKESLTETYIRFTSLVNQLKALGVFKEPEILLEKFCDILPSKWEYLILVLRQGKTLHSHTLNSLYGAFRYTEENSVQRAMAERDAVNHVTMSSPQVQYTEPKGSALVSSESVQEHSVKKVLSDLLDSGYSVDSTTGLDESDNDDLMAMMAKTFNRFKSKANRSSGSYASSSTDKANLTCFKCGKKGHFMKECRSGQTYAKPGMPSTPVPSPAFNKPTDRYKDKYKKLKAQIALMSVEEKKPPQNGCLIADEKWETSDTSSDEDDEERRDMCFMALDENQKHVVKDDVETGRWVNIVMKKVGDALYEKEQVKQLDRLDLVNNDLVYVETLRSELARNATSQDLSANQKCLSELKEVHLALKTQQMFCADLSKENQELQATLKKEQMIIKSWLKIDPSKMAKSVQYTVPDQRKAYLSGDLNLAAVISEVHSLPEQFLGTDFSISNAEDDFQNPHEVNTEVAQTSTSGRMVNLKKPSPPSTSKAPKSQKMKKIVSLPEPPTTSSGKAQVSTEESILLRLERQFQLLSRQVQSCNTRMNNFEASSSKQKQNAKPFTKQKPKVIKAKNEGLEFQKPISFSSKGIINPNQVPGHTDNLSEETLEGESSEPISRWVPKSN
jgi:hypothetical protein